MDDFLPSVLFGGSPLVGRDGEVRALTGAVEAAVAGRFQFLTVVGEPGVGKTRLLAELATLAKGRGLTTLSGRAAEFEQIMPFSVLVDALDDHLEAHRDEITATLGPARTHRLAAVFPALPEGPERHPEPDRFRLYRALRVLIEELAEPDGLALLLDDVHWADDGTAEFLDHLLRHPPRGRVLVAAAYRPAQLPPRSAMLVNAGKEITVGPFGLAEVEEFLGPSVTKSRSRALFEASAGNPFYLEALARMDRVDVGALPPTVRAALQVELSDLSRPALRLAQAAAVTADEFEPSVAAVTARMPELAGLSALDELVARDIVRPAGPTRFRFRHPLVRQAAYESASAGWRLAAHARLAEHLAAVNAPATVRARHVERSATFGDQRAIETLLTAAREVAYRAPGTCAHWLRKALDLMPVEPDTLEERLELLMELSRAQGVSGRLVEGRNTARELLRLLPADAYARRARAARICALMERQLDRPHEARALLLDELGRMPNPRSAAAIPLRMRLVAESMMRMDFRAARAVLDLMPDCGEDWTPDLTMAVAAMRPMPAYAAGRMADALRMADSADRLVTAALDEHIADWLDAVAWLCWAESNLGRHSVALRHFQRAADVARATGQTYILPNLLAGKARALTTLGRLPEAMDTADEAAEQARLLGSGQQLVFALTQLCLAGAWSGEHEAALHAATEAVTTGVGAGEFWGNMVRHARGVALVAAARYQEGIEALLAACGGFEKPRLDRGTLLVTCELLAHADAARGNPRDAVHWAARAAELDHPDLPAFAGLVPLARAHAESNAALAEEAAGLLGAHDRRVDSGRALLAAGLAHADAGRRGPALDRLREASDVLASCGAKALAAKTIRERRRLGDRVARPGPAGQGLPFGLSAREYEIANLVAQGLTNQRIAETLHIAVRTVETHLSRVFDKLKVTSRVEMVVKLTQQS
jgi:DNA-binding CsgD family transcriptional regulator